MSKMPKINSNLICITGFVGEGKTTTTKYLKDKGFNTFITDEWIHQIYKKGHKGYKLIKRLFGNKYVTNIEVNRLELKNLILKNNKAKYLLEKHINKLIYKRIKSIQNTNKFYYVELGIYLFNVEFYQDLFNQIILILNKNKEKNNDFRQFCKYKDFQLKKDDSNIDSQTTFYANYLIENNKTINDLYTKLDKLIEQI